MTLATRIVAAAVLFASAACERGATSGPTWIPLARDVPAEARSLGRRSFESAAGRRFELVEIDGREWLRTELRTADWWRGEVVDGVYFKVPIAVLGTGRPTDGTQPQRLHGAGTEYEYTGPRNDLSEVHYRPGQFYAGPEGLFLKLGAGESPPAALTLDVYAHRSQADEGRMRVVGDRFSGDGFALWPGDRLERVVDIPPDSVLSFATSVEPAIVEAASPRNAGAQDASTGNARPGDASPAQGAADAARPIAFRVLLDDRPIFSSEVLATAADDLRQHTVPLPASGRRAARLVFAVDGAPAYASFLAPVIGPRERGTYGERPLAPDGALRRPDLIVFLADTFRADNLATYGREDGLTPFLDRFALRGRVYPRAYSVGTYTLPAHFSMFAGVWPLQVGASGAQRALPRAWTTLAEHLSDAGYRTGAVTESVFVSRDYSFDQGFEWWDERLAPIEDTLDRVRAFLDADDGRPVFLFVQTYRTHTPYVVQPATRERLGAVLPLDQDWNELNLRYLELPEPKREQPDFDTIVRGIEALYRGAAADLDVGFERFCRDLERRGLDRSGYLVFTSDHGEAFHEHDVLYHAGKVWEELVRIPLIVAGPGIKPGRDLGAASLLDLAPTLCDMAGVEPRPEWLGSSWLDDDRTGRPILLFQCQKPPSTVGVVEGLRKVIELEHAIGAAERPFAAYDLAEDPRELLDVSEADWSRALLERFAPALQRACEPVISPENATLDAEKEAELRAMGYTGD